MKDVWTVSELNEDIKNLFYEHYGFLWVEGEVSDLRRPSSGHFYFYLKDENSRIRAVIFRGTNSLSPFAFELEDGMHITCRARLTVYSPRGEYQLIIDRVEPVGIGALKKAYEQLKAKLEAEGFFDAARKKPIPFLPNRIGVVTSPTGAVIRDILNITARRCPTVNIVVAPVRVQGWEAPGEIVEAIENMNKIGVDVIILARGGGSFEDLYPFNTEEVARAIFASSIPIVSAIGHETDYTISDFVADLRAPTPSAAAELVVPSREDLINTLQSLKRRLINLLRKEMDRRLLQTIDLERRLRHPREVIEVYKSRLQSLERQIHRWLLYQIRGFNREVDHLSQRLKTASPSNLTDKYKTQVQLLKKEICAIMKNYLAKSKEQLTLEEQKLGTLNPFSILGRGYSVAVKMPEEWIIRDSKTVSQGDEIRVILHKGRLLARVAKVE